jgi:hypothetical protein
MASGDIPSEVRRLILEAIDSVPELEALLLLRDSPALSWTPDSASSRLYVSPTVAAYTLDVLAARGFLERTAEGFHYRPSSPDLEEAVGALARTYAENLVAVTKLIHAKPGSSLQDFARAFRLRKD